MSLPSTARKPGIYFDLATDTALGLPLTDTRVCLIGTKRTDGTAVAGELVQISSVVEAQELFGHGSSLALLARSVLEENAGTAGVLELWAVPLAEAGSGVAATGNSVFAVSGLETGVLTVFFGAHSVAVDVDSSMTAANVCTAVVNAITADDTLPFNAAVNGSNPARADFTARTKGTAGNGWVVAAEFTGSGLTATITQPSSGATDPAMQDALDVVHPESFPVLVSEYNGSSALTTLAAHLDDVSGALEQRPGIGIAGYVGTLGNATTLSSAVDNGRVTIVYLRGTRTHPMELAGAFAAHVAARDDLALPLNGEPIELALAPDSVVNRLTRSEQETCLANGVTPLETTRAGTVHVVRWVTTYLTNTLGVPSTALMDGMTIRVLDYVRAAVRGECQTQLAQVKLASTAVTARTTDPGKVRTLILGVLLRIERTLGYLQDVTAYASRLTVEQSATPGRLTCRIPAAVVPGLHQIDGTVDLVI